MFNIPVDFLRLAYNYADKFSPDPSTRVGAIIVTADTKTVIYGCNHLTDGMESTDLSNRTLKYKVIEHAERDAIFYASKRGISLQNATMYCPWAACCDCARAIVLSGIQEVICHGNALDQTPDRWKEDIDLATKILEGSGVKYTWWYGNVGDCQNLFNGKYWSP
jgi:dCMP deaminase